MKLNNAKNTYTLCALTAIEKLKQDKKSYAAGGMQNMSVLKMTQLEALP